MPVRPLVSSLVVLSYQGGHAWLIHQLLSAPSTALTGEVFGPASHGCKQVCIIEKPQTALITPEEKGGFSCEAGTVRGLDLTLTEVC